MRLRIALVGIKPTPWRRVEVLADTTLLDLHAVIQTAMGWEDEHLFSFRLLGRHYDSERRGPAEARLADFQLRPGERFTYTYNHCAPWDHELRVEAISPGNPRCRYPRCTGGRHSCPPEQSFGPAAYEEELNELLGLQYSADLRFLAEVAQRVLDNAGGSVRAVIGEDDLDELECILDRQRQREVWLSPFNRRAINRALLAARTLAAGAAL